MPLNDKKLIKLRVSRGLSQNEVAKCANISQATLSHMESGKYPDYRVNHLESLAKFYGVSVDYLLDYVPEELVEERHHMDHIKEHALEVLAQVNRLIVRNANKQAK